MADPAKPVVVTTKGGSSKILTPAVEIPSGSPVPTKNAQPKKEGSQSTIIKPIDVNEVKPSVLKAEPPKGAPLKAAVETAKPSATKIDNSKSKKAGQKTDGPLKPDIAETAPPRARRVSELNPDLAHKFMDSEAILRSNATVIAFMKDIDEAPSSKTLISLQPSEVETAAASVINKNAYNMKPRNFNTSFAKIHDKWHKIAKDPDVQLNTLYPRSVFKTALEEFQGVQAFRQYSYNVKVGQEEHARLPPDRPGMAQSDDDNLKLLPNVTEEEARKHLTERVSKRKLKQKPQKQRHRTHSRKKKVIKPKTPSTAKTPEPKPRVAEPPPPEAPPPEKPAEVAPELPPAPVEVVPKPKSPPTPKPLAPLPPPRPPPPSMKADSIKGAGDAKPRLKPKPKAKAKSKSRPKSKPKKKKHHKKKHVSTSSSSSSSRSERTVLPCCFQQFNATVDDCNVKAPNVCDPCEPKSGESSDEGLDFQFRPAHPDCATEVTLTIEPDEQDPLEFAMDNGIRPVICCTMPPCLMVTPNIWQQPHQNSTGWGPQQSYNGWSPQQQQIGNQWSVRNCCGGGGGSPQQNGSKGNMNQNGGNGSPQQQNVYQQQMAFQQQMYNKAPQHMGYNNMYNNSAQQMGYNNTSPQKMQMGYNNYSPQQMQMDYNKFPQQMGNMQAFQQPGANNGSLQRKV